MTTAASAGLSQPARDGLARIALAGFAGGVIDFVYPSTMAILRGRPWESPWLAVASGWVGKAAREGGPAPIALGIVTHFGIATVMAAVYALAFWRLPIVQRLWWAAAPAYGVGLFLVMNFIVLPLRWPGAGGWMGSMSWLDLAAHIGVALAFAWVLGRGARAR